MRNFVEKLQGLLVSICKDLTLFAVFVFTLTLSLPPSAIDGNLGQQKQYNLDLKDMRNLNELKATYGSIIRAAAKFYSLDEALLAGLIWQESRGEHDAKSAPGAYGLTQIMPATADERGYDLNTPEQQIHAGADYLKWIDKYFAKGNVTSLLAAYNAGVGRLKADKSGFPRWMRFEETRKYVVLVQKWAEQYRQLSNIT